MILSTSVPCKLDKIINMCYNETIFEERSIKRYTVSCDHIGRYWLALQIDVPNETIPRFKPTGKAIGIDCGLTHMVVLSNGDKVEKLDTTSIESQARLWQRKYSKRYHRAKRQLKLEKSMGVENPRQMKDFKNVERARLTKARRHLNQGLATIAITA